LDSKRTPGHLACLTLHLGTISLSQVNLPVSPSQWAFKVIKLKKLPIEDLHLAPWFLTYLKRHAVVPFVVCAGLLDCRLGRLEKNQGRML